MLRGKLVRLRAVEPVDYPLMARWLNDPEVMTFWGEAGNTVSVDEVARKEQAEAARGNSRKYVVETADGKPIGEIDYYDLDWLTRSAWVSILIGDGDYWGGGYGTEAMRTLLTYLFREMGLHRVSLTTHATNTRAIKSYEKNGFVREGTLRDWGRIEGRWVDGLIMSVLEDDFARLALGS